MIRKSGIISIFLLIILANLIDNINAQYKTLLRQFEWKFLEFQFPDAYTRDRAIQTKQYVKGNSFPIDVDAYFGGFVF